jgi:hypothetical protein
MFPISYGRFQLVKLVTPYVVKDMHYKLTSSTTQERNLPELHRQDKLQCTANLSRKNHVYATKYCPFCGIEFPKDAHGHVSRHRLLCCMRCQIISKFLCGGLCTKCRALPHKMDKKTGLC